ncbi:hypothetical protein ACIRG5_42470 [Lentzea sp. NPDC102401]|uniref:DUF7694 domain-containing protein n=1 Tax=Lentzea sp. NPDC102401 TaxID=3364128 RepID=UPI003817D784
MADLINALEIRKALGPKLWGPPKPMPPDGCQLVAKDGDAKIIVSGFYESWFFDVDKDRAWIHASISRASGLPTYEDLGILHRAVWGTTGTAYQCFVPPTKHINIHARALHLWGRADGTNALPDFGKFGTI